MSNPCDKWFCVDGHFGIGSKRTEVFAARFDRKATSTNYKMSWDLNNSNLPGVDRSDWYNDVCAKCGKAKGMVERDMSILDV